MSDEQIKAIAEAVSQIAYSLDPEPARQHPLAPGQHGARAALETLEAAGFDLPPRPPQSS